MPCRNPNFVIAPPDLQQCQAEFLDGVEAPCPEQILFQRADEAPGAAVALRPPYKGRRAGNAEEGGFALKRIRDMLAATIVPFRLLGPQARPTRRERIGYA